MAATNLAVRALDPSDAPRTRLGESPRWDGAAWWWVDADPGHVWTRTPGSPAELVVSDLGRTPLVLPTGAGDAMIVQGTSVIATRRVEGQWRRSQCDAVDVADGWLVNDGTADAAGRLWIGSIEPSRASGAGELIRVDQDGSCSRQARGFTASNGMAWSADNSVLYHADTLTRTIWQHTTDLLTGTVIESTIAFTLADSDGLPDGLATDQNGGIWVAVYGAAEVRRYTAIGVVDLVISSQQRRQPPSN